MSNVNPSGKAGRISIRYTWRQQFNDSTCPLTQTNKFFILEQSFQVLLIKGGVGASITMRKKIVAQPRKLRQCSTKSLPRFGQQPAFLGRLERDNGGCNFAHEIHPIQRVQVPGHHCAALRVKGQKEGDHCSQDQMMMVQEGEKLESKSCLRAFYEDLRHADCRSTSNRFLGSAVTAELLWQQWLHPLSHHHHWGMGGYLYL